MVVCIVGKLKDMGREMLPVSQGISVGSRILLQYGIRIRGKIFVRIESNDSASPDAGVYRICHKSFTKTCHDDVVRNGRQLTEVGGSLQTLVNAHRRRRLPGHCIKGTRADRTAQETDSGRLEKKKGSSGGETCDCNDSLPTRSGVSRHFDINPRGDDCRYSNIPIIN